ncbi:MAG: aldehyde dehydrogenase family protein [Myxococcales bacterium]|nr:aldehyde dehydrogenase family protein [Myxococcales bacterium]
MSIEHAVSVASPVAAVAPEARAPATIRCFDPATLEPLGEVPVTPPAEVVERIARARRAQARWAETSFDERRRVLGLLLEHVTSHADELAALVVRDSGKTRENAMLGEIWPVCEKIRYTLAHGEKHLRPERRSAGIFPHKRAVVLYQPLGVIGIICPWNYPLQNVLGPTIPALFAGNAVVVKVSEWTAWSSARIQAVFDAVLRAAGHDTDLVQIVNGYGDTGAALVSGGVDKIVFTGSVENGRRVLAESARTLTPVVLELGGKDAFIVCDDADLEQAAHAALAGAFIACGQNCLAAERMLVFDAVYERFVTRVTELAATLRVGASPLPGAGAGSAGARAEAPVDLGAITSTAQLAIIERLVADAVARGARVLTGGRRGSAPGLFYEPTVLEGCTPDMAILQEETFGPIICLVRVADEAEAIATANATRFGLSATVMTRDRARAERMARAIVAGGTSVNDFGLTYMAMDLPFGGVRNSGFGRLNGREGLRACTNPKAVLYDRLPFGMPAKLYPVGRFDYELARSAIQALYAPGLGKKLAGAWQALRTVVRARRAVGGTP